MEQIVLKCSGYHPEGTVYTRALRVFEAELAAQNQSVKLEVTANITERGHKAVELLDMVARGDFDLCYFNTSYLAEEIPSLRIFDLPFVIADRDEIFRKLDGELGRLLAAEVSRARPYRVLQFWDNGFRHISNRLRPIREPRDCEGLRFRTVDSRLHQDVFRAMGLDPVHIDVRDLPEAVRTLKVDGQENPLTNTLNLGVYQTQKYQSLTHHFFGAMIFIANRDRYDALPEAVRHDLDQALALATREQRILAKQADETSYRALLEAGCEIVPREQIDMAKFKAATSAIYEREMQKVDPAIRTVFEAQN